MKKLLTLALVGALALSLAATASATETMPMPSMEGQIGMEMLMPEMTEEMLAELEALAEAAGMTLEEYLATMEPEMLQGMEGNIGQGMEAGIGQGMEGGMGQGMEGMEGMPPEVTPLIATATESAVYVDGVETSFEAYNIDGSNYFKLRDLAAVFSGSEKEFDVTWDSDLGAIVLVSDSSYTAVGGELAAGDGTDKVYTVTTSTIYMDGVETAFEAYNINDNNYFKLRDVCSTFDIGVTWNSETSSIEIDTSISYTE